MDINTNLSEIRTPYSSVILSGFTYFANQNALRITHKNVHNVQNFVYNYKNKQFDFKSARNPYIYCF